MKLAQLDSHPGYVGPGPIAHALQWLETLLNSPAVQWDREQFDSALHTLQSAREVMATEALVLAQRVYPHATPQARRLALVEAVAADLEANPATPPAPSQRPELRLWATQLKDAP